MVRTISKYHLYEKIKTYSLKWHLNVTITYYLGKCGKWALSNELKANLLGPDGEEEDGITVIPPSNLFDDHLPSVAYLLHVNVNNTSSCTVSILNSEWMITSSTCISKM